MAELSVMRYPVTIDLAQETYQCIDVMQGNKNSITIDVYVTENGLPVTLPKGDKIVYRLESARPDHECSPIQKDFARVSGNVVTFECIDEYVTSYAGQIKCIVAMYDSVQNKILKLPYGFYLNIIDSPFNEDGIVKTDEFSSLNKILLEFEDIVEALERIKDSGVLEEVQRLQNMLDQIESSWNAIGGDLQKALDEVSKIDVTSVETDTSYKIYVTDKKGTTTASSNLKGYMEIGNVVTVPFDDGADVTLTGNFGDQQLNFEIPMGKPLRIVKHYTSIAEMRADYRNVDILLYDCVVIDNGVMDDVDTSKIYMKGDTDWIFIVDLKSMLSSVYKITNEDIDAIIAGTASEVTETCVDKGEEMSPLTDEEIKNLAQ